VLDKKQRGCLGVVDRLGDHASIRLFYNSGLRVSESRDDALAEPRRRGRVTGKGGKTRVVRALARHLGRTPGHWEPPRPSAMASSSPMSAVDA
jgi:site-specific recombinase XerC